VVGVPAPKEMQSSPELEGWPGGAGPAEEELGAERGGEVRGSTPIADGVDGGLTGGGRRGSGVALAGGGEESRRLRTNVVLSRLRIRETQKLNMILARELLCTARYKYKSISRQRNCPSYIFSLDSLKIVTSTVTLTNAWHHLYFIKISIYFYPKLIFHSI
jgi:hypothetical protein